MMNNYETEYLSKIIPYLFPRNYKRIFYFMNENLLEKPKIEMQLLTMKEI